MGISLRCYVAILGVAILPALVPPGLTAAQLTRDFPAFGCRFTLPSEEWRWDDESSRDWKIEELQSLIFMAKNKNGLKIGLLHAELQAPVPLDQKAVDSLDSQLLSQLLAKREGHFGTFRGIPCYNFEGTISDGRNAMGMAFLANRRAYILLLVGAQDRFKQDTAFEPVRNGFAFAEPPLVHSSSYGIGKPIGEVSAGCLFASILAGIIRWSASRKLKGFSGERALTQYKKDMRGLGNALIGLGILNGLVIAIGLTGGGPVFVVHPLTIILGISGALVLGLGVLARRLHASVNRPVAILAWLSLALDFAGMGSTGSQQDCPNPASAGAPLGVLITALLLYYAIKNIQSLRQARAAGLGL